MYQEIWGDMGRCGHCCGTHLPLPALGLWYAKRQGWHSAAGKRLSWVGGPR